MLKALRLLWLPLILFVSPFSSVSLMAQQPADILSVSASTNKGTALSTLDNHSKAIWEVSGEALDKEQWLLFTIQTPGNVCRLVFQMQGLSKEALKRFMDIYVTYDSMNLGEPVDYSISGSTKEVNVDFMPKYGAFVKVLFKRSGRTRPFSIRDLSIFVAEKESEGYEDRADTLRYMDSTLPVEERVESLLAVMTPEDKMELIREGWGIPGIPPSLCTSYYKSGSGARLFLWERRDHLSAGDSNGCHLG